MAAAAADCKYENKAEFNLGPTTAEESMVYGAARPGAKQQRCYTPELRVTADEVAEWVDAIKAVGVTRVVSMLSDSELATYAEPLPAAMEAAFGAGKYININAKAPEGPAEILKALQAATAAGDKVVVHCWGGGGRTGIAQAAYLMASKGMSAEEAAEAVASYAKAHGLSRRVDVAALKEFAAAAGVAKL
ncbi:hypothetical protein OEZ85_013153 [Tetradesmus obliquus]|uniref:Tyrosine specific protein phosphatases domain-containing protein n=1 Tax=Tetradesmus obliquus TaxID=3088 RepID=A0ABY8U504_TETOB|nr:hypothetical protein OEZ85_013153 [Tetradesmus obliquus]